MYNTFGKKKEYVFQKAILTLSLHQAQSAHMENENLICRKIYRLVNKLMYKITTTGNRYTDRQTRQSVTGRQADRQTDRLTKE